MDNSVTFKPNYTAHRRNITAADSTDLAALYTALGVGAFNAKGWDTIHGFVKLTGGITPTITLQPLERVEYESPEGTATAGFVVRGSNTSALSDGSVFEIATNGGGRWLLRAHAVTGGPTNVEIFIAGGTRANEGSI